MDEGMDADNQPVTKGEFRAALSEFKTELKEELRDLLSPMQAEIARHSHELADIRHYMRTELVTKSEFHERMDGFAKRVTDQDYHSAKTLDRLDDHERRITKLERKPS